MSNNYYSTLTKAELKARRKYIDARIQDCKYSEYLTGMLPANYGDLVADLEQIDEALKTAKNPRKAKVRVKVAYTPDTLVYNLYVNNVCVTTSEDDSLVARMSDDYSKMGYEVKIESFLKM